MKLYRERTIKDLLCKSSYGRIQLKWMATRTEMVNTYNCSLLLVLELELIPCSLRLQAEASASLKCILVLV